MMYFCTLCKSKESSSHNYLLRCVKCRSFFHHRCHRPPVQDSEMIAIFKHYNLQKQKAVKNPTLIWTCGTCAAAAQQKQPQHRPPVHSSREDPIILVDSDDDSKPSLPLNSRKSIAVAKSTNRLPQFTSKRVPSTSAAKTPNPAIHGPVPNIQTVQTRPHTGIRIIDDPFIEHLPSPRPPKPPLRAHKSTSSTSTSTLLSAELGGLHVSNQQNPRITHTSSHQLPQQEQNDWDLEYVTPPAPPPLPLPPDPPVVSQPHRQVRIAQSLPPIVAIVSNDDDDEEEEQDEDEDEDDEIDATPAPAPTVVLTHETNPQNAEKLSTHPVLLPEWIKDQFNPPPLPPNAPNKPFSGKKPRAQNLATLTATENSASRHSHHAHLAPFFFHVDSWLREKKGNLPRYHSGFS